MDLYVGAIAISNICFLRGAYSWAYIYKMHANAFIRYEYRGYLVTIWRKSFSTHLSTINVPIPGPSSIILRGTSFFDFGIATVPNASNHCNFITVQFRFQE